MKAIIWVALAVALACVVAGVLVLIRPVTQDARPSAVTATHGMGGVKPAQAAGVARPAAPPEAALPSAVTKAAPAPVRSAPPPTLPAERPKAVAQAPGAGAQRGRGGSAPKEKLQDPLAREALALVGLDSTAEAYWCAAINDPNLPAHERQDLIEDLNEDGLSDPKHPAPEDLPVILSRLQLIEATGPYAMDEVNAHAFDEAYKDLANLAEVAVGGGELVR